MQKVIQLFRVSDNRLVDGILLTLNQKHLDDFKNFWQAQLILLNQEDKYWDWILKKQLSISEDNYESYAIECEGITQGLMTIETQWHGSQVEAGKRIIYVKFLATAPWNRSLRGTPKYKTVGTLLLLFARQRSVELGYEGRLGLHALPGAVGFYEAINMPDYGPDPEYENLIYFEYSQIRQ